MSTTAISTATRLHENTVRGHLDQLRVDGYVERERGAICGRGRPAWLWRAVRADPEHTYARLASALAETLARTSTDPVGQAREAGRSWGAEIAAGRADSGRDTVVAVMREQGYAPVDDGEDVLLNRCPLIEAAAKHPDIVCAVHLGLIDGLVEASGERNESELVPFTSPGQCTLHLRVAP